MQSLQRTVGRRLRAAAAWLAPPGGHRAWIDPGIGLAICLAILTSVGPWLQFFALSALNGRSASLYESAFQQNFTAFPTLGGWLFSSSNAPFLAVGVAATLFGLRKGRIGEVAGSCAFWMSALLTAIDVLTAIPEGALSVSFLATNAATNAIGAGVAGLVAFLGLSLSRAADGLAQDERSRAVARPALLAATGLVAAAAAYYAFLLLYQSLPAQLEIVLRPPMSGMVTAMRQPIRQGPKPDERFRDEAIERRVGTFSWLPTTGAQASFSMQGGSSPVRTTWRPGVHAGYRLEVRAYDGCLGRASGQLPAARPIAVLDGAAPAEITLSTALFVDVPAPLRASYSPTPGEPMIYWLSRPERDGSRKVSTIGGGGTVDLAVPEGVTMRLSTAMIERVGNGHRAEPRRLDVVQRGRRVAIELRPAPGRNGARAPCRPIAPTPDGHTALVASPLATILVEAVPTSDPSLDLDRRDPTLSIAGLDDFVDFVLAKDQVLKGGALGAASSISFGGGSMSDLHIDGVPSAVRSFDQFSAAGTIEGEYLEDGSIRLSGTADQLVRNGRRLNATRWERLSPEMQVLLLTALAGIVALIARFGWPLAWRSRHHPIV